MMGRVVGVIYFKRENFVAGKILNKFPVKTTPELHAMSIADSVMRYITLN